MIAMYGRKPVAVIRNEKELAEATREVCELMRRELLRNSEKERYRKLVDLIEDYEDRHDPIPEASPKTILNHLLSARDEGIDHFSNATGVSRSDIRAILFGQREISHREAQRFARYFHVDPSVFENDSETVTSINIEVIGSEQNAKSRQREASSAATNVEEPIKFNPNSFERRTRTAAPGAQKFEVAFV